jgi:hypothetical protein
MTMKEYHILNLGAGVQSTTLMLLAAEGRIRMNGNPVKMDAAIFADTGEEPDDAGHSVMEHLAWLQKNSPIPILIRSAGTLGDDLVNGSGIGKRVASIPAFTLSDGKVGKIRRQCTEEYKIKVIERSIRRDVLELLPRQRIPSGVLVHQYIGISVDEAGRMLRAKKRAAEKPVRWSVLHYPLIEQFGWTRGDCRAYLKDKVPHRVPRSACVFCPYHDNGEWAAIKARNGKDWARAVEIDRALRAKGTVANLKMDAHLYLHRTCKPLEEIDFITAPNDRSMAGECGGTCGT